jgi:hypothetical protein
MLLNRLEGKALGQDVMQIRKYPHNLMSNVGRFKTNLLPSALAYYF